MGTCEEVVKVERKLPSQGSGFRVVEARNDTLPKHQKVCKIMALNP